MFADSGVLNLHDHKESFIVFKDVVLEEREVATDLLATDGQRTEYERLIEAYVVHVTCKIQSIKY